MYNTEGDHNTAIGEDALEDNTTGEENVSIGAHSMDENETGSRNVAVGYDALENNIDGDDNVAIGTALRKIWIETCYRRRALLENIMELNCYRSLQENIGIQYA